MSKQLKDKLEFNLYKPDKGHPDWDELMAEARERAADISRDITRDEDLSFKDRQEDNKRKRKSYITTLAGFLENRRRLKNNDHCLRPSYWIWVMLNGCNLQCKYCDDHSGVGWFEKSDSDGLDTAGGMKLLRFMRTGCSSVYFCGGEPTLRDDFPEFVDEAFRLGYYPMALNSNITIIDKRLKDPKWKEVMRKLDILTVSVDALNPDTLDGLYQKPLGKTVLTNVLMLREIQKTVKFMYIVNTVVTPETIHEARAVLDWCNDLGIFYTAVPANFKEGTDMDMINNFEYRKFVKTLLSRKRAGYKIVGSERILEKFLNVRPYTCLTTIKPHINSDGSLPWPCRASANVKPVNMNVFDYDNVDDLYRAASKIINPTNFHGSSKDQCGGLCAWYQNYTTEIYRETLLQPWKFIKEARELTLPH